ncbi:hypothetical protein GPEL0_01f4265 [Geoanaerobacter pelophilus]|uniref:Ice-binding protein C-terminal domain-containing protein n=2 Tax=Geoanaerobacter pelophilus TaxID=60036 RepID=A0ABQ0MLZ1_9BACT|nr:hypothetical protein GPEL0_01f4265 [Geoanaerobacter pelophilus]
MSGSDLYFASSYVENGFKVQFITANGDGGYIGDYYGAQANGQYNDVIHGHWGPNHGTMTAIEITKEGGGFFDLNYFILTSNTQTGGWSATGNELAYIEAWGNGTKTYTQLLPSESWGWKGVSTPGSLQNDPQIFLGSEFDAVDMVRFTVANDVFCFGMDEFYIDQPAPSVPEPSTLLLLASGLCGVAFFKRRNRC